MYSSSEALAAATPGHLFAEGWMLWNDEYLRWGTISFYSLVFKLKAILLHWKPKDHFYFPTSSLSSGCLSLLPRSNSLPFQQPLSKKKGHARQNINVQISTLLKYCVRCSTAVLYSSSMTKAWCPDFPTRKWPSSYQSLLFHQPPE